LGKVVGLLKKARDQLRKLSNNSTALVQLNENSEYFTNLNEIRVNFESTFIELDGFRPVITKLLQLMSRSGAVNQGAVRTKIIGIFKKIRSQIHNMEDEIEASKSSQDAIFTSIVESYKENLTRIDKLLERLNKEKTELVQRQTDLVAATKESHNVTAISRDIFKIRKGQCIDFAARIVKLAVGIEKTRNIIAQIASILEERFGKLKSYFLQREMKIK